MHRGHFVEQIVHVVRDEITFFQVSLDSHSHTRLRVDASDRQDQRDSIPLGSIRRNQQVDLLETRRVSGRCAFIQNGRRHAPNRCRHRHRQSLEPIRPHRFERTEACHVNGNPCAGRRCRADGTVLIHNRSLAGA